MHFGLSMFLEFEKFPYPSVISISFILNILPHITKLYKHGQVTNATHCKRSYHIFSLTFSWFWTICNALQRVTIIFFIINTYIFINLMVTRCNVLQIAPNHVKLRENVWWRMWLHVEVMVTHWIMVHPC